MRASAPAATERQLAIIKGRDERRRRPTIADPSQRHGGGLPRVEILSVQLLDERDDDAGAVAHQRLDDMRADGVLTKKPRQRALNRFALEPSKHAGQPRQTIRAHALHRVENVLRARGGDMAAHEIGDVIAGAVAALVPSRTNPTTHR